MNEATTNEIRNVITSISDFHEMISKDFKDSEAIPNLARMQIKDFIQHETRTIDKGFLSLITNYQELATKALITSPFEFDYRHLDFRSRIKQPDSIVNKLLYYTLETDHQGRVSVNKCLNDLLGFRIHFDEFDHNNHDITEVCQAIQDSKSYKIACKNSCKDEYKGTHVYFYGTNFQFPWELQIWNVSDATSNEQSHSMHKAKRAYINWPQEHKEARMDEVKGRRE